MERCNGFKIRGLNADCDRLACQSSVQDTWLVGRGSFWGRGPKWHEVALGRDELMVLRPYGGCPEFELVPLGDAAGLLIVNPVRQGVRSVRVGQLYRVALGLDETCVLRCEQMYTPMGALGGARDHAPTWR